MRVIDAKNVEELLTSLTIVPNVIIEKWLNEHTVKAIPIEWIEKWVDMLKERNYHNYTVLMPALIEMLEEWEKENGKD